MSQNKDKKNKICWLPEDTPKKIQKAFETRYFFENKYKSFFKRNEKPNFLPIERKSYEAAFEITEKYIKRQFNPSNGDDIFKVLSQRFFNLEYIRRFFFLSNNQNLKSINEAIILSELRKKYGDIVKINNQNLILCGDVDRCYYRNISISDLEQFIKYPFYYNQKCQPECNFKIILKEHIDAWHEKYFSNPNVVNFFESNNYSNNLIESWPDEYKKQIKELHNTSYKYGMYVFDLFGMACPEMLLNDAISMREQKKAAATSLNLPYNKINTLQLNLKKYIAPEIFYQVDDYSKPNSLTYMDYLIIFDDSNITIEQIDKKFQNYPYRVILDIDFVTDRIDTAVGLIKKGIIVFLEKFTSANVKRCYSFIKKENNFKNTIILGLNPFDSTFNIDKCISNVKLTLTSLDTYTQSWHYQIINSQEKNLTLLKNAEGVKNYHQADISRLIGLFLWDQIHILEQSIPAAIACFADSELYEKIKQFDEDEITVRNMNSSISGRSSVEDRRYVRDCYEAAKKCVNAQKALGCL